ncbi:exonuclease VII small subunit [Candidatus Pelagibacter sp.]|nr:exonuclease VII small subunit [Candidatus Pelagibacter sp.]
MKDKNIPNDYNSLSLEELTIEANKMIEELENQKDLGNSLDKYQDLIKLNKIIEKKFQKNIKEISKKTKEKISRINKK